MRLEDARKRTPPVPAVESMRNQLQLALFGAVSEGDVVGMATRLKEMALQGDLKAMKLLLSLIDKPSPPPAQVLQIERAVVELRESVAQIQQAVLVRPEPAAQRPALPAPRSAPAGSEEKLRVMQERAAAGLPLTSPEDAGPEGRGRAREPFHVREAARNGS